MSTSWPVGLGAWAQSLQQASFRGVAFWVSEHRHRFGRRVAVHDYPFQDLPQTEDLGSLAKGFRLHAYVLGPDYFTARDQLYNALAKNGPGTLVHPYLGSVQVNILDVELSETTREGGIARFDIRAVGASAITRPAAAVDTQTAVLDASGDVQTAADAQFGTDWSDNVYTLADTAQAALDDAFSLIEEPLGIAQDWASVAAKLLNAPDQITARLDADLREFTSLFDLQRYFGYSATAAPGETAAQPALDALSLHIRTAATFAAAELTSSSTYASYDEAIAARDTVLDQIDAIAGDVDAGTYDALVTLRTAVTSDIDTRAADLASLTTYTPPDTLPALVLAQQLYGPTDVQTRADDIVARNGVEHPLFISGGQELEVLSD